MTSTSSQKSFIRTKQLDKPFNGETESVKQALDHGIRNEALVTEKHQFIMSYKLNRPVKMREAGIIIHSQPF